MRPHTYTPGLNLDQKLALRDLLRTVLATDPEIFTTDLIRIAMAAGYTVSQASIAARELGHHKKLPREEIVRRAKESKAAK